VGDATSTSALRHIVGSRMSNIAVKSDACELALRAFFSAPYRER
jgi:hypothetical protein